MADIQAGFNRLEDTGHLIKLDEPPDRRRGRPTSTRYRVNPHHSQTWDSMTKKPNSGHSGHAIRDPGIEIGDLNSELAGIAADECQEQV